VGIPIIGDLIKTVGGLAGKFITDKDKLAEFNHEMGMTLFKSDMAQIAVNQEQAKHASIFVAGGRPAVMWVCVIALFINFVVGPLANWAFAIWLPEVVFPTLEDGSLMTLLFGMLGMGGLRSYDKKNGTGRHKI